MHVEDEGKESGWQIFGAHDGTGAGWQIFSDRMDMIGMTKNDQGVNTVTILLLLQHPLFLLIIIIFLTFPPCLIPSNPPPLYVEQQNMQLPLFLTLIL